MGATQLPGAGVLVDDLKYRVFLLYMEARRQQCTLLFLQPGLRVTIQKWRFSTRKVASATTGAWKIPEAAFPAAAGQRPGGQALGSLTGHCLPLPPLPPGPLCCCGGSAQVARVSEGGPGPGTRCPWSADPRSITCWWKAVSSASPPGIGRPRAAVTVVTWVQQTSQPCGSHV